MAVYRSNGEIPPANLTPLGGRLRGNRRLSPETALNHDYNGQSGPSNERNGHSPRTKRRRIGSRDDTEEEDVPTPSMPRLMHPSRQIAQLHSTSRPEPTILPVVARPPQPNISASRPEDSSLKQSEKQALAESGRALHVSAPYISSEGRGPALVDLRTHISAVVKKAYIERIILQKGTSPYFIVILDTASHRDKACAKLQRKRAFISNDKEYTLSVRAFGEDVVIWRVWLGPLDTVDDLAVAIQETLGPTHPAFSIRKILDYEVWDGSVSVRFSNPPSYDGARIMVHRMERHIEIERKDKCRLCKERHNSWECTKEGGRVTYGEVVVAIQQGPGEDRKVEPDQEEGEEEAAEEEEVRFIKQEPVSH